MSKPKIRFKGYEEDWEQRKLSDITLKIGSGKTPSGGKNAYVDDGIPLIRSQNINNDRVDLEDIVFIDEETDNSMENSRVFTDDVLLNITGASIGRSAVYRGKDKANVNQHVCIIRPTKDFDSDFIQLNLASNFGQKQIDASQAGGGREGLNFQEIGKMSFMFPSNQEQMKIGVYFNHIDYLITLMKHRDAADSKRYRMLAAKFIEKYGVETEGYDVIKGWRANASYFYIAKEFVRDNIDIDILEELLSLGGLGIQYCIKSEKAYNNLHELKEELVPVDYSEFNERYNDRDVTARKNMRDLINSDANEVTKVFSTLL